MFNEEKLWEDIYKMIAITAVQAIAAKEQN